MAAIFIEGFDKYGGVNSNSTFVNTLLATGDWTTVSGSANAIVAGLSVTGTAVQLVGGVGTLNKTLIANYTRLIGGCRFAGNLSTSAAVLIQFRDVATPQCTITLETSGAINLRNGTSAGTILGGGGTVAASSTHYVEWDITFGNAAAYQVWLDGVSLFSGTGDTTGTVNNYANALTISVSNTTLTVDDLYLFDSTGSTNNAAVLSSPRVETTFPASDSAVQFGFAAGILGSTAQRVITLSQPPANNLILRPYTPSVSGTLASISFIPGVSNGAASYRPVVYADTSGAPGALLSAGSTVIGTVAGTTVTMPLTTPQSLVGGTRYWLGFMCDTAVNTQQSDAGVTTYRAAATFASGAPGTAPAMTGGQANWLFWGTLTGITGNNWYESAQQPPPGGLSYVFDATVGHEDLYNFGALSVTPTNIYAVAVKGYLQRSDSGAKTASLRTKSGASDSGGSLVGQTPPTTFGWVGSMFELDPQTGAAWTGAGLNAAQSGVKVDS